MGRTTADIRIQERSARARLKPRHHPYWRMISEGCHIGYYRGTRGGTWVARFRTPGANEDYFTQSLGMADDLADADGSDLLNWKQALEKVNAWFALQADGGGEKIDTNMTVKDAVLAFIEMRDARQAARVGRPARSTASFKLKRYVLRDKICSVKLCQLSESDLRSWQRRLGDMRASSKPMPGSSKQRILSELKAALNDTFVEHRKVLPKDLAGTIKFGCRPVFAEDAASEPVARENQVVSDKTVRAILAVVKAQDADGDNFVLAVLLAATGARFSQIVRMNVRDVDLDCRWIFVPPSRKGRGKKIGPPIRIQVGPDVVDTLRPFVANRAPGEPLLERWHYRQVKPTEWVRVGRQPWKTPSEMQRWWKKAAAAASAPGVIPYALRHSSIVRGIGAGIPIRLVAAMHDASVGMIEKHYARWITESLDDVAARAIVPLLDKAPD